MKGGQKKAVNSEEKVQKSEGKDMKGNENKTAPPSSPYPWLVFHHGEKYANQTFCSLKPGGAPPVDDILCKRIPALKQRRILSCSSYGWLVLYDYTNQLFSLCNCTTFDNTPLPKLDLKPAEIDSYLLTSSPESPDCKVFLFLKDDQFIMCCRLGGNRWSEIRYGDQLNTINPYGTFTSIYLLFCHPVICKGKIYANLKARSCELPGLWSIEIVNEEAEEIVLSRLDDSQKWDFLPSSRVKEYVVESDGEIYCVQFTMGGMEKRDVVGVEIRKFSWDSMVWERVNSLKNRSFFLCPDYCFSCPTPGFDFIFFTMFEDLSLYTYNLDDESLLVSLPCRTLPRSRQNYPIWMMPEVLIRPEDCCSDAGLLESEEIIQEKSGKEGDEEKQLLTNLPFDVLEKVAKNLVIPHDYLNFRSVSRICRSVAPLINWRKALSGSETDLSFPLHMFAVKSKSLYRFVHPQQNSAQSYLMTIPTFPPIPNCPQDAKVCYSNHGWLLMVDALHVYLYNPFKRDIRSYIAPNSPQVLFFTSKPSTSTCFLVRISFLETCRIEASILRPRSKVWTRPRLLPSKYFEATDNSPSPVLFQDAFYFLDKHGNLARLSLEEKSIKRWEVLTEKKAPCDSCQQNFLVECGGELLSIFVGDMGKWIHVYKLNFSERVWETLTSLNGYNLYLSQSSSFSLVARPGLDNRIYFPRFRDGGIVFHSVDTAEWNSFGSQEAFCDFYDTGLHHHSCWIKPTWS